MEIIKPNIHWDSLFDPLPDNKIFDWSKLKQVAHNILECI